MDIERGRDECEAPRGKPVASGSIPERGIIRGSVASRRDIAEGYGWR